MSENPTTMPGDDVPEDDVPERFSVNFEGLTLLGTYRVGKKLADGGMGSVYLAEDLNLGRPVVVKVPHPRFLGEPGFRTRFAREVSELVRLEHPHVARILARGEHEQLPFFVLQFLGGGSLEDRIREAGGKALSPEAILPWLQDVAATLDFVHERGIVHRDVKPGNILFDEGGNVFLSDFGVAKALDAESALTGTGVGIGSPKYMAPEQGLGGAVGPATDQYALASVVYEALTGTLPFGEGNIVQILVRKGKEEAPDITATFPSLPVTIAEVVMKGLAREPEQRYGTCREFAEAFAAAVQAEGGRIPGTPARGTGSIRRTKSDSTWVERRHGRWGHTATLGAILVAAVGVFLFLVLGGEDPKEFESSPAAPPPESGTVALDPDATRVVLVEAGDEPRRALRYEVAAGDRIELAMTTKLDTEMRLAEPDPELGEPQKTEMPEWVMGCEIRIEDVAPDGRIDLSWEVKSVDGVAAAGTGEKLEDLLDGFLGTKIRVSSSPRGIGTVRSVEAAGGGEIGDNPLLKALTSGIGNGLHEVTVPLPEEPVGLGARWEVTRVVSQMGLRLIQTTIYELRALEGNRARIHLAVAQTATEQRMRFPGVPDSAEIKILSMHSSGRGEVELLLTEIAPVSTTLSLKIAAELEVQSEESTRVIELDQRLVSSLERR